jgi:hypothetical protein
MLYVMSNLLQIDILLIYVWVIKLFQSFLSVNGRRKKLSIPPLNIGNGIQCAEVCGFPQVNFLLSLYFFLSQHAIFIDIILEFIR